MIYRPHPYDEDDFDYDNEDDFDDIQDMYSDDIDLEHSSCCICRIPEEWKSKKTSDYNNYFLNYEIK